MKTAQAIGSRETATITNPIHPTWGTVTEVRRWEYTTEDGIKVNLETYSSEPNGEPDHISMMVIHSKDKYCGNTGNAKKMASAKRWITKNINSVRVAFKG